MISTFKTCPPQNVIAANMIAYTVVKSCGLNFNTHLTTAFSHRHITVYKSNAIKQCCFSLLKLKQILVRKKVLVRILNYNKTNVFV